MAEEPDGSQSFEASSGRTSASPDPATQGTSSTAGRPHVSVAGSMASWPRVSVASSLRLPAPRFQNPLIPPPAFNASSAAHPRARSASLSRLLLVSLAWRCRRSLTSLPQPRCRPTKEHTSSRSLQQRTASGPCFLAGGFPSITVCQPLSIPLLSGIRPRQLLWPRTRLRFTRPKRPSKFNLPKPMRPSRRTFHRRPLRRWRFHLGWRFPRRIRSLRGTGLRRSHVCDEAPPR